MAHPPASVGMERVAAFALALISVLCVIRCVSTSILALFASSLPATLLCTALWRGHAAAVTEGKAILQDAWCCVYYLVSLGCWKGSEQLKEQADLPWPHLRSAVQLANIFGSYLLSYGILSVTVAAPLVNTIRIFGVMLKFDVFRHPHHLLTVLEFLVKSCCFAVLHCVATNVTSHRYFSHKSFKTSRVFQAVLAIVAAASGMRSALWWSSQHRLHHRNCGQDTDAESYDPHNPNSNGGGFSAFLYAHQGWLLDRSRFAIRFEEVVEWWSTAPELLIIEMFSSVIALGTSYVLAGYGGVASFGFFLSLHFEGLINSLCHKGKHDDCCGAVDSPIVGFLTGGEGFHLGHHKEPLCANHAWYWSSGSKLKFIDLSYSVICILEQLHLVWDVRHHPYAQNAKGD